MIRILSAIIRALMAGGGQTAAPRPRRQVRSPARSNTAPTGTFDKAPQPVAESESDFEKMVRQMFGVPEPDEKEAAAPVPPPPAPPQPRREHRTSSRAARATGDDAIRELGPTSGARRAETEVETRGSFVAQELTSRLAPLATDLDIEPVPATPTATYASRLRRNPAAARDAFVFAEIFGPPLADRQGDSRRGY